MRPLALLLLVSLFGAANADGREPLAAKASPSRLAALAQDKEKEKDKAKDKGKDKEEKKAKAKDKEPADLVAEAKKHVDKEWSVEMKVNGTGNNKKKTMIFLNSEKNYRSDKNFTVVLDVKSLAKELKEAKITDPAKHYSGKKVKVTGTVTLYQNKPQIEVKSLKQIAVVEEK